MARSRRVHRVIIPSLPQEPAVETHAAGPAMNAFATRLSDRDAADLAAYSESRKKK
jgi:cytochrome c553